MVEQTVLKQVIASCQGITHAELRKRYNSDTAPRIAALVRKGEVRKERDGATFKLYVKEIM